MTHLTDRPCRIRSHNAALDLLRDVLARVVWIRDELDPIIRDQALFNAANGTIDLRTGELRAHRRDDLLTHLTSVAYECVARSELWERFLNRVTGGDRDFAGFLQRATGYSLTGHTSEEVLFFPHGPTATGKSSLLEAFRAMLADYAATADFESFLARRGDVGVRNDIARLAGSDSSSRSK